MVVPLSYESGDTETFVVRAQNMHLCIRLSARLMMAALRGGALMKRAVAFDWQEVFDSILSDYEYSFNPRRWVAVYHQGRVVFQVGDRHPFLDVIEKCQARNNGQYDAAVAMAEQAFQQTGKPVHIAYEGNVALAANMDMLHARLSHILRGSGRTTTFSVNIHPKKGAVIGFGQCLMISANFLEGIQLAFTLGTIQEKIKLGAFARKGKEERQLLDGRQRLLRLEADIRNIEEGYKVRYRPEKPSFPNLVVDSEDLTRRILSDGQDDG
jgi:hypothetical protein